MANTNTQSRPTYTETYQEGTDPFAIFWGTVKKADYRQLQNGSRINLTLHRKYEVKKRDGSVDAWDNYLEATIWDPTEDQARLCVEGAYVGVAGEPKQFEREFTARTGEQRTYKGIELKEPTLYVDHLLEEQGDL